jgi:hypothetical protein
MPCSPALFIYRKREEYRAKGMEYLRVGERKKAFECFQKCVDVTPEMAYQVIKVGKSISGTMDFLISIKPYPLLTPHRHLSN